MEAGYVTYPTLGWPKGQQQTPESCCSITRQMRNPVVLDVNEALTFTVINSRNTKLSQHNRWIGGGATPTELRGGYILAHSTDLHQVLCHIEMPQLFGMCETTILGHVGVMVKVERTKQRLYVHRFMWSHDFPMVMWLWESRKITGNKRLVHWKIRY